MKFSALLKELSDELRHGRDFGQPLIDEFVLPKTGALRVTVVWDKWAGVTDGERAEVILKAYEQAEGTEFVNNIALASGLTAPEAVELGLLPYRVSPALRKSDPFTVEQCRRVMIEQGASIVADPGRPILAFMRLEDAEKCVARLINALPKSESIWTVAQTVGDVMPIEV
jgi:hypothetical protein